MTKYVKNARLNDSQFRELCYCFSRDYTATQTAENLNISRQTTNNYYKLIRTALLISNCDKQILRGKEFEKYIQSRRKKLRGIKKEFLILHEKECEFRYAYDKFTLYRLLLKIFRQHQFDLKNI